MYAKLFGFLLFACQVILNGSQAIPENTGNIINVTPTLAPGSSTLPEGYVRFPDLHAAYKVYKESITWVQARDRCITEGADLAIADTVEKIERIYAMQSEVDDWISVGIRKSNTTDDWVRVDNGHPLTFIPWLEGSPRSHGDCAGIAFGGVSLANFYCTLLPNWYVCEIPI